MITYFVGFEEVRAYLRELVQRLKGCDPVPNLWCPLTDSIARHGDFRQIRLSAISNMVDWYRKFGYEPVPGRFPIPLGREKYVPMERVILHHIPLVGR